MNQSTTVSQNFLHCTMCSGDQRKTFFTFSFLFYITRLAFDRGKPMKLDFVLWTWDFFFCWTDIGLFKTFFDNVLLDHNGQHHILLAVHWDGTEQVEGVIISRF